MMTETNRNGQTVKHFSTKETAQMIREALKASFPGVKFSVRTEYFSGGSATRVTWTDGPTGAEVELVTGRFTSRGFDGMTDCTTYHTQQQNGETVSFSGWVTTSRRTSSALLRKAVDRYNQQRAEYGHGPASLDVADGSMPHLTGADVNAPNPCGGRAAWVSDAVYQIAGQMRPNGVIVRVKGA